MSESMAARRGAGEVVTLEDNEHCSRDQMHFEGCPTPMVASDPLREDDWMRIGVRPYDRGHLFTMDTTEPYRGIVERLIDDHSGW